MIEVRFAGLHIAAAVVAAVLSSCSETDRSRKAEQPTVALIMKYDRAVFGRDVSLSVINTGKRAICFTTTSIAPTSTDFVVKQNGVAVPPGREANRESVFINGIDVAEGVMIVPAGKKRTFSINIDDFALKAGQFSASLRLYVFDCVSVFSSKQPLRQVVQGNVVGNLPPR